MTNAPMPPARSGLTRDENPERLSSPPASETADDGLRSFLRGMHPRQMLAMGDGMPVVIKQLVQVLFLLCWPLRALIGDKKTTVEPADGTVIT